MATVKAFIRVSNKKAKKAFVRFRLSGGRTIQLFHKSDIEVEPNLWDPKNECIKAKVIYDQTERADFMKSVADRKALILRVYNEEQNTENLTSDWLDEAVDKALNPDKYGLVVEQKSFFQFFDDFIRCYRGTERMKQHYKSVKRIFQRYELYIQKTNPTFKFDFESLNPTLLRDVERFIHIEHELFEKHQDIYKAVEESRPPKMRGKNRTNKIFRYFRTFVKWAIDEKLTTISNFPKYKIEQDVYGSPYYLTIDERNNLYKFDFTARPQLAIQRDIFIFHCLVGCRIGDLSKLTKKSIINGAIEYVPRKTKEGRPVTVRVPLNSIAKEIVDRYSNFPGLELFPFISDQNYNLAIKDMFKLAELTRLVTVINPTTGNEEKQPLDEIASSHIARRTFIGNLYKKVKDPNLVGSLSGHKEGSRAFARYREIDEEMKQDLVKLLE